MAPTTEPMPREGVQVNRFEALHILDLDETATDEDVRLAYYGIDKALRSQAFDENERLWPRVRGFGDHAREARDFLLANGAKAAGGAGAAMGRAFRATKKRGERLRVSAEDEAWARLSGLQSLRAFVLSYRDGQLSTRRTALMVLAACVVASFFALRFLRGMPRIVGFCVLAVVAVAGSTALTTSMRQCAYVRDVVDAMDRDILRLRVRLGIAEEPDDDADGGAQASDDGANALVRWWRALCRRVRAWAARRREAREARRAAAQAPGLADEGGSAGAKSLLAAAAAGSRERAAAEGADRVDRAATRVADGIDALRGAGSGDDADDADDGDDADGASAGLLEDGDGGEDGDAAVERAAARR